MSLRKQSYFLKSQSSKYCIFDVLQFRRCREIYYSLFLFRVSQLSGSNVAKPKARRSSQNKYQILTRYLFVLFCFSIVFFFKFYAYFHERSLITKLKLKTDFQVSYQFNEYIVLRICRLTMICLHQPYPRNRQVPKLMQILQVALQALLGGIIYSTRHSA